jgi:hypothetical protein
VTGFCGRRVTGVLFVSKANNELREVPCVPPDVLELVHEPLESLQGYLDGLAAALAVKAFICPSCLSRGPLAGAVNLHPAAA